VVKQGKRENGKGKRQGVPMRFVFLAALLLGGRPLVAQSPDVGAVAPVVTGATLDGKPVRIAVAANKRAAVVEFWATWCPLCRALLPSMRAAQRQYGDRVDFIGVNVTVNERKERVQQYLTHNKPPWVTVWDDRGVAVRAFGAVATSYVVIIDAKGRVAYIGDGGDQNIPAELAKVVGK
jgi:thiol-disulfide isomerase/thioredoxin